jgi:aminomethyltransferase
MGSLIGSRRNGFPVYGNKRSGFHAIAEQLGANFTLHGRYFVPDDYGDPVAEYWGFRRTAGLVDASPENIREVRGPDASRLVNYLLTRDVSTLESGQCIYSPLCYEDGGIINDGVLLKLDDDRFWYSGGAVGKDDSWWLAHARDFDASVELVTDEWSILQLQGPSSLKILNEVVYADISDLRSFGVVDNEVAGRHCVVSRTGWTGEKLGYEVYVRTDEAEPVWMAIWEAGQPHGMTIAGLRAIDIRRIEQGTIYNWGSDFDERNNPYEVNLGWAVNLEKEDFIGKRKLAELKEAPPRIKLVGLKLDGAIEAACQDPVLAGDRKVGHVTAGAYSPYLNQSIALAHVERGMADIGKSLKVQRSLDLAIPAEVVQRPFDSAIQEEVLRLEAIGAINPVTDGAASRST